jgi:hypothetical protein
MVEQLACRGRHKASSLNTAAVKQLLLSFAAVAVAVATAAYVVLHFLLRCCRRASAPHATDTGVCYVQHSQWPGNRQQHPLSHPGHLSLALTNFTTVHACSPSAGARILTC